MPTTIRKVRLKAQNRGERQLSIGSSSGLHLPHNPFRRHGIAPPSGPGDIVLIVEPYFALQGGAVPARRMPPSSTMPEPTLPLLVAFPSSDCSSTSERPKVSPFTITARPFHPPEASRERHKRREKHDEERVSDGALRPVLFGRQLTLHLPLRQSRCHVFRRQRPRAAVRRCGRAPP